ncbi:MAG: tetratricopeptide repeat protein [Schleiferiaceae bacterium]|nr:tetratricopeptide repeat protein [Schleiferiaceae bacterium]
MRNFFIVALLFLGQQVFGQSFIDLEKEKDSITEGYGSAAAVTYFKTKSKEAPENTMVALLLALAYAENNDSALAATAFKALERHPQKPWQFYLAYAKFTMNYGDVEQPEVILSKGIAAYPKEAALYAARAALGKNRSSGVGFLSDFNKAIALEPQEPEWYLRRGLFNLDNGYFSLAEKDLRLALQLEPKSANIFFLLARLHFEAGQPKKAQNAIDSALYYEPDNAEFISSKGRIFENLEDFDAAFIEYERAIAQDSTTATPHFFKALLHYQLENMDAFCESLHTLVHLKERGLSVPTDWWRDIQYYLDDICDSSKASYYYQRGIAAYNTDAFVDAILYYEKALLMDPKLTLVNSFIGNAFFELQAYKDAIHYYEKFLDEKESFRKQADELAARKKQLPNDRSKFFDISISEAYYYLGMSRAAVDDLPGAIRNLDSAIYFNRNHRDTRIPQLFTFRGLCHAISGNIQQAMTDFNSCLALHPQSVNAHILRTTLEVNQIKGVIKPVDMRDFLSQDQLVYFSWEVKKAKTLPQVRPAIDQQIERLETANAAIDDPMLYYLIGTLKLVLRNTAGCDDFAKARFMGLAVKDPLCK